MTPSSYQTAIFRWATESSGNLVIDAKAGSGKTTTLIELLKCLPVGDPNVLTPPRIRFLAFNKHSAETLQRRCPRNVVCSTFHALGLSALRSVLPKGFKIESGKVRKIVWNACDRDSPDIQGIIKLVGLAKTLVPSGGAADEAVQNVPWDSLIVAHDLNFEDSHLAKRIAASVLRASNTDLSQIDFDDMLYLPILLGCPFDWQDWVLVDEAQDTNDVQVEILAKLQRHNPNPRLYCAHCGEDWGAGVECQNCQAQNEECRSDETSPTRFVFVGDPHQSIYGFRGANSDAMTKIVKRFNAATLPLSVSYRCSRAVIREAQRTVPDILPCDEAPEGSVETKPVYPPSLFVIGSTILCRNTAPLVAHAYALLTRDIPCTILGKDIGAMLSGIVKKMRAVNIEDLQDKLIKWRSREADRAIQEQRSPESIEDQYACIRFFIRSLDEDSQTIPDLLAKIELLFSDNEDPASRVILSTIHKAKGLEYPTVFILDRHLLPSRYATQPWQRKQESNLLYVAQTRAILNLIYISSECWEQKEPT